MLNILILNKGWTQTTLVLPGNGKYSSSLAPQGALRYQRQFYLLDSTEIARSGITSGLLLRSIGFTYAAAQSIPSKGQVKVYLQNTGDTTSKSDTAWTSVQTVSNRYYLNGLSAGGYEWQVSSNCSPASSSSIAGFNINNEACKSPTHLITQDISATTAKFSWVKPANAVDSFIVEWSEIGASRWQRDTTDTSFYMATGLAPEKTYKWKVTSLCARIKQVETTLFTTASVIGSCTSPTAPTVTSKTDVSAVLSWTAATGAVQYDVWYRRAGTSDWNQTFSASNSINITGLNTGTVYEWQVRTVCEANAYGSFVSANSFTTTGTTQCYPTENVFADSATNNSVKLSWDTVPGATSYTLKYRKRESISWGAAIKPMTLVTDSLLVIPDTTGLYTIPFNRQSSFAYTGKGIYVAVEYANAADTLSSMNVALANYQRRYFKDAQGEDSASMFLGFEMTSDNALPSTLTASFFRPETWFGSATLKDSAAVLAVYAMGNHALPYGSPSKVSALVRNYSLAEKSYAVTLKIRDASNSEVHSEVKNITVKEDSLLLVNFASWTPTAEGKYSILVSIPGQTGENVINNNSYTYQLQVNPSLQSYADGSDVTSFTGMDTTTGLILARYSMNGCGAVNAVQVYLGPSAAGRSVHAVIMDAAGKILDSTAAFIPDSATVNRYQNFYFPSPVTITNGADFYVGLAQKVHAFGYAPVGVQWEGGYPRSGAYYRANLDGSGLKDTLPAGRLMIRAEFVAGSVTPAITGNLILCPGGAGNTLSAASISRRFANQAVTFSSEGSDAQFTAAEALGTPNVYPQFGFNVA
ncbi:MAG: fibronectin type III domain-containing protein, partial [Bacteroidota bacterium]|nr:fibronectin type III domain-containing protein [Bacteroidota bacterium]